MKNLLKTQLFIKILEHCNPAISCLIIYYLYFFQFVNFFLNPMTSNQRRYTKIQQ